MAVRLTQVNGGASGPARLFPVNRKRTCMHTPAPFLAYSEYPRWSETLRDGSHVLVRPISPLDRDAERRFIEELSSEARHFRFLGQVARPTSRTIDALTRIDLSTQAAFAAVVRDGARERFVGTSRYSADPDGLRCECTVTVMDDWQDKGLGTLLMRHLIDVARAHGMRSMYSVDSAENIAMSDLAFFLGFRTRRDPQDESQLLHELQL